MNQENSNYVVNYVASYVVVFSTYIDFTGGIEGFYLAV